MTVGLIVCRYAGQIRDRLFRNADSIFGNSTIDASDYRSGLLIAIVSGLLSAFLNFALAFGDGITHAAVDAGANPASASYAIWPVALAGGLVPNAGYSVYLLNRNGSWKLFLECWPDLNWATLMGLLWMGAVAIYSVSTSYLGELGTSAGWGLYEIFMILAANASGLLTGEWRGVGMRVVSILGTGLLFLILATFFLARSNV
jgi:L-rhamnose-H+ transport protein